MNPSAFKREDVVYVMLLDAEGQRVLVVENEHGWTLPGGLREPGETLAQAAVREAREETGLAVEVGGVVHISEKFFVDRGIHALFVTFIGRIVGGSLTTGQDGEIRRVAWKTLAEAQRLMPWYEEIESLIKSAARYQLEPS